MNIVRAETEDVVTCAVIDGTGIIGVVGGDVTANCDSDITVGTDACTGDNCCWDWTITICCVISLIDSVITFLVLDDTIAFCADE